jgi:hypothetical protein
MTALCQSDGSATAPAAADAAIASRSTKAAAAGTCRLDNVATAPVAIGAAAAGTADTGMTPRSAEAAATTTGVDG